MSARGDEEARGAVISPVDKVSTVVGLGAAGKAAGPLLGNGGPGVGFFAAAGLGEPAAETRDGDGVRAEREGVRSG